MDRTEPAQNEEPSTPWRLTPRTRAIGFGWVRRCREILDEHPGPAGDDHDGQVAA